MGCYPFGVAWFNACADAKQKRPGSHHTERVRGAPIELSVRQGRLTPSLDEVGFGCVRQKQKLVRQFSSKQNRPTKAFANNCHQHHHHHHHPFPAKEDSTMFSQTVSLGNDANDFSSDSSLSDNEDGVNDPLFSSTVRPSVPHPRLVAAASDARTPNVFAGEGEQALPVGSRLTSQRSSSAPAAPAGSVARPPRRRGRLARAAKITSKALASKTKKLKRWFRKCRGKHLKSAPELEKKLKTNKLRQDRQRKVWQKVRKAKKMEYAARTSRSATMKSLASLSSRAATLSFVGLRSNSSSFDRQKVKKKSKQKLAKTMRLLDSRCSSSDSEDDIAGLEFEGAEEERSMGDAQIASVISELRKEPKNDVEVAEKFEVYEQYLATVEKTRHQCMVFHRKCCNDLAEHTAVLEKMARAIKSIDKPSNTSIDWDNLRGRWFVHDMTVKSDHNNAFIGRVFTGLKRDLELVSDNDMDCPICLDNLKTAESGVRVLRCCHKLCGECYDNWKEACTGTRLICPLCRQTDFQEVLVRRSHVQHFLQSMASDEEDSESDSDATIPASAPAASTTADGVARETEPAAANAATDADASSPPALPDANGAN